MTEKTLAQLNTTDWRRDADKPLTPKAEAKFKNELREREPGISESALTERWEKWRKHIESAKAHLDKWRKENTRRSRLTPDDWLKEFFADTQATPSEPTANQTATVQMDNQAIPSGSILIATVTKVEAQSILETFKSAGEKWTRQQIGNKTYYNLGVHGGAPVFMVQSEMGTATPGGALLTVRQAIQDLRPQAVIMCGIAFGLHPDKQQLGDILVAKQIQCYESQKVDLQQGQLSRGDRATCAERLLDRFRSGDNEWHDAKTHFRLVLSGEKLVNDPDFRDRLLKIEPEAIGGDMEGAGLYVAARDAKVDWILVKAICDWADGKKNNDAQELAARNASQFVLHVLQLGGWDRIE